MASEKSRSIITPTATADCPPPLATTVAEVIPCKNPTNAGPARESGAAEPSHEEPVEGPENFISVVAPVVTATAELAPHCVI